YASSGAIPETKPDSKDEHSIADLVRVLAPHTPEFLADELFQNRQRTSTRGGILKAEAVVRWASILHKHGLDSRIDLWGKAALPEVEEELAAVPGQCGGIA